MDLDSAMPIVILMCSTKFLYALITEVEIILSWLENLYLLWLNTQVVVACIIAENSYVVIDRRLWYS
jgi:hypothetical protein